MIKRKIKEWLKRYLPAEIIGTITALWAASIAHSFSQNLVITAYCGSIGEAIGFYSTIFFQNLLITDQNNKKIQKRFSFLDLLKILKTILFEFGPAGILDGILLRPFFMILFPVILKNFTLGILVGKIAGDITFYFLVIISYEIRKRNQRRTLN